MDFLNHEAFRLLQKGWSPLLRMEKTDKFASQLGIKSYYGRFAFAQLTHLDLPFKDIKELAAHIDSERMNWDSRYAMDMATFISILVTNRIPCQSWEELKATFKVYEQSWKSRFIISLFCEGISKKGYYGHPLYYSELVGYRKNEEYHKGLLDIAKEYGLNEAFEWMHKRIFLKIKSSDVRTTLEADFRGLHKCRVYPYLIFGSPGWASYDRFEKLGGIDCILSPDVPGEVKNEVYIMVICCFSAVIRFSKTHSEKSFSNVQKLGIKELVHFGADTSIAISPLFSFLQSEIGHIIEHAIRGKKLTGILSEFSDRMMMHSYNMYEGIEKEEEELDYSNLWSNAPPEMIRCVKTDLKRLPIRRSKERYRVNKEWLKKLKEGKS